MRKRGIIFERYGGKYGEFEYNTALYGWTLTGLKLSDPEQKTNYVEKPGGDGSWDLSTTMTDGHPVYKDRTLTATFECSDGTRDEREELIDGMVNNLDGMRCFIYLPDKPNYYLDGRIKVAVDYSDLAHAAVTITAVCDPWFTRTIATFPDLHATATAKSITVRNNGRKPVVPEISVIGTNADVTLTYHAGDPTDASSTYSVSMTAGNYTWPELVLVPGDNYLTYMGSGMIRLVFWEAVLR